MRQLYAVTTHIAGQQFVSEPMDGETATRAVIALEKKGLDHRTDEWAESIHTDDQPDDSDRQQMFEENSAAIHRAERQFGA